MSLVQQWLKQAVIPYPAHEHVYADVDSALSSHRTVRPKTDVYTYDDGRAELLLCVHGLLPISFRGGSYNIPIAVWIPHEYPRIPPIVYVVPNSDMLVKPSPSIDASGRCSFPYLRDWEKKSEGCSLRALLDIMQEHFSREPPLYAKPKKAQDTSPPPLPPSSVSGTPVVPPRPSSIVDPLRSPSMSGSQLGSSSPQYRPPPPLPSSSSSPAGSSSPHPARPPSQPPIHTYTQHQRTSGYWNMSSPTQNAAPGPPPSVQTYHQPVYTQSWQGQSTAQSPPAAQPPALPQYMSSALPGPPPPAPAIPKPAPVPTPNLMDSEEDLPTQPIPVPVSNAPPRPPNPELIALHHQLYLKLTAQMTSFAASANQDSERLRAAQNDLLAGEPSIRDEMARLEAVRDVCRNVSSRVGAVVNAGELAVAELKRKGDPEVDELICATNIVHNQLINLVAEDHAIEDTVYHLHKALNDGRLDLDKFLRTTTRLAEEQFMKRALIEKITSQLPIGMRMV